ncbi:MAG: restriction endonuclease [Propionivibrio sp.]|uniref:DpnI domain-containing protein n=1 Tax=Propionivibrio sp. TaxID=2212460 RepID=UPI0026007677|nr:DpnI domain-containing protein [Propionivibrio sp.]MBL0207757.1 restriction endonuclease [Propionivibrio sp.]
MFSTIISSYPEVCEERLPMNVLSQYKSATQRARVFSESWIEKNFKCPQCSDALQRMPNNTRALDLLCRTCAQGFELKSKRGAFGPTVPDGAYASMLSRIRSGRDTNLILLGYTEDYVTRSVVAIPNRFLIEEIIIPRKPLGEHCRRAGWQGCNINIGLLPPEGRIVCVQNFVAVPQDEIRENWKSTAFLEDGNAVSRSWLAVTMGIVSRMKTESFSLADVYNAEKELARLFPNNRSIKAKVRQQLQILRDRGWLSFLGNGRYAINPHQGGFVS